MALHGLSPELHRLASALYMRWNDLESKGSTSAERLPQQHHTMETGLQNQQDVREKYEDGLHTNLVPGTEIMADDGSHHFIKSERRHNVLIPQPSNDAHDPLNWSPLWKFSTITCATLVSFSQGLGPISLAPITPQLVEEFHSDLSGVIHFTGVTILVLAFSNFLWAPLSTTFGRRFVLLSSSLLCIGSYCWKATATSYSSFMGAAVLTGIAAGPAEVLQPTVIADVLFLHERGFYNTLYYFSFFASVFLGPIICGSMAEHVGWRKFWWLNVALNTLAFFAVLFGFPETKWHRTLNHISDGNDGKGHDVSEKDPTVEAIQPQVSSSPSTTEGDEKEVPLGNVDIAKDDNLGRGSPSKEQWMPIQLSKNPITSLAYDFILPWKVFLFPIVQFASFATGSSCTNYLMITFIQSAALIPEPYHFSSQAVGFTSFASLVGAFLGLMTAGPASDLISATLTRRNKGVREPEMRLLTLIPYVLIMVVGNFVVSYGFKDHWNWRTIVVVGFGCAGIQIAAIPAIVATYAIDSYKPASGAILVSITMNKNLWGYGVSQFITPWVMKDGYVPPFMTNMCLTLLWCSFGVVFWIWGKKFRMWTAKSSVHRE